jgi:hypothetical protein
MKRLKGPELKLSELKVPPFLTDLYWDLHDRHLLPLIALGLVAIVAVPILFSGGSKQPPEVSGAASPLASGSASEAARLTVVPAEPGLREPSKRLAGRPSKDPFKQHYTGPVFNGGGGAPASEISTTETSGGSTTVTSSGGSTESASQSPSPEPAPAESGAGGSGGSADDGSPDQITLFTFAIDVKVAHTEATKSGAEKMGDPTTLHEVLPTTPIPGKKAPVVTYLGPDAKNAKTALMLISPEVDSLFGDAKCLSGVATCQLLALEPNIPEIFVYGPGQTRYKIELLKIEPVKTGRVSAPSRPRNARAAQNFSK